ncbi:GFA family protein [Croceicoccus ponticola]|uniref:GFA family protein n=1 Tax=Croceicoccus ponticola TaxID=2217664 RepID=UPI00196AB58C|nr:GFA family protein [Croceicoccus ponticola]
MARKPDYINFCNCGLCRPTGAGWGYFPAAEVEITGEPAQFGRTDIERWLTFHFCPGCGSAVAWTPYGPNDEDRMGVNMRLFPLDQLTGIPARWIDGLSASDDTDAPMARTGDGVIGDGKAF